MDFKKSYPRVRLLVIFLRKSLQGSLENQTFDKMDYSITFLQRNNMKTSFFA